MSYIRYLYSVIVTLYFLTIVSIECFDGNLLMDTAADEGRKRKRPFFMKPFAAYTWLAGLVAIKIKVAVIVFTVLSIGALFLKGFIGYGFGRFWWPGCGSSNGIYSSPYAHEIIGDHPPPSSYHHHDYDLDHSGSMIYYDRVRYPQSSNIKTSGVKTTDKNSYYTSSAPSRHKREINDTADRIIRSIETFKPISRIEEICKRRYVCESDVRARHNIAAAYQLYFFGREGLAKYRDKTKSPPRTYEQCAQLYKQCNDPMNILYGKRKKRNVRRRKWYSTHSNTNNN